MRRKPTAIHLLNGTYRADRHGPVLPSPAGPIPSPPKHLFGAGLAEWNRIAPELFEAGVLTQLDVACLATYCSMFARWVEAEAGVAEQGLVVRSPNGYPQNPFLSIANQAAKEMRAFAAELGMSPASRSKVSVSSPPQLGILKRHRETN